jgi:MurNAc alpha-1-phosphate uridylyltransferase
MRAILFAAGRGERMKPLTERMPKALLAVGGKALVVRQLERLAAAGIREVVVNVSHFGEQVESAIGDGSRFGLDILWSREPQPLETAGAIAWARERLGPEPFLALSADIHTAYDYARLVPVAKAIARDPASRAAHFVLVDNPPWHAAGDMGLRGDLVVRGGPTLTYANISVFHPALFDGIAAGTRLALFPWAYGFVDEGRVTGERFAGEWDNVGTPAQLEALDRRLSP